MNPFFLMALQLDMDYAAELVPHEFERFASLIDPEWIDEASQQTGTASIRRRRLPAERMVWLVIGLALFRDEPIWHIVQQLDLAEGPASGSPVPSAAVAGRERLGEAPLAWLFDRLARSWANASLPSKHFFMACAVMRSMAWCGSYQTRRQTAVNSDDHRVRMATGSGHRSGQCA